MEAKSLRASPVLEMVMTTAIGETKSAEPKAELHNGDTMTQPEFHRIYEQMGEDFRAELIGGIVYVGSPLKYRHGRNHLFLGTLITLYSGNTPGTDCGDNTTVVLGDSDEVQPDLVLRVLAECGGQSRIDENDYIRGAPELLIEVAMTSASIDLHFKRKEYARHGVPEYLVLNLREQRLHWFDLRKDRVRTPDADGVCRIEGFPGLWLHADGVVKRDFQLAMNTLNAGLNSAEHAAFAAELASRRK